MLIHSKFGTKRIFSSLTIFSVLAISFGGLVWSGVPKSHITSSSDINLNVQSVLYKPTRASLLASTSLSSWATFYLTNSARDRTPLNLMALHDEETPVQTLSSTVKVVPVKVQKAITQSNHVTKHVLVKSPSTYVKTDAVKSAKSMVLGKSVYSLQNFVVASQSHLTGDQLNTALKGTGLQGLGLIFAEAEQRYHVNALVLVSIAALESGWGTSTMALTKNNLFGFGAYTSNPNAAVRFASKKSSIMETASLLSKEYLSPHGEYYSGKTLKGVNKEYSTNKDWSKNTALVMMTVAHKLH